MRIRNWQALALAGLATFAVACGGGDTAQETMSDEAPEAAAEADAMQDVELPEGVTMEMVNTGRQLFSGAGGCYACHGPQALGTQLAPDLTDDEWINVSGPDYDEVVSLVLSGVPQPVEHPGPMPPMGGANLTEEQVHALAAYVVALGS